jgi:hypothetical protein
LASHSNRSPWHASGAQNVAVQFVERTQQMMLTAQPALILCDDARAFAVGADPEWIAPFAAAADVDSDSRNAGVALVENPAHRYRLLLIFPLR